MFIGTIGGLIFGYFLYRAFYNTFKIVEPLNMAAYIFKIYIIGVGTFTFIYSMFDFLGIFYFAGEIQWYRHLPIKPYLIILVKFGIVVTHQIIMSLLFIPLFLSFGVLNGYGVSYYIMSALFVILFPFIPIAISGLMAMILMRFSKLSKSKDLFKLLIGIFSVSIGLVVNVVLRKGLGYDMKYQFAAGIKNAFETGPIGLLDKLMLPYNLYIEGITTGFFSKEIAGITILLTFSLVSVGIMVWIGNKIYIKSTVGLDEVNVKKNN